MISNRFPILFANQAGERIYYAVQTEKLVSAIETIEKATAQGQIANVDYKDVKDVLNRALANAWMSFISTKYTYAGKWEELPREIYEVETQINSPQAHTINAVIKKLDAAAKKGLKHQMFDDMRAFCVEVAPLGAMVVALKDKVVKRQPKAPEDETAKYRAPYASLGTIGEVKKVLDAVTETAYQELLIRTTKLFTEALEKFLTLYPVVKEQRKQGLVSGTRKTKEAHLLEMYREDIGMFYHDAVDSATMTRSANADKAIAAAAKQSADFTRDRFVYKNLSKIDSILERKGDFEKIESIGYAINLRGLEGTFKVTFKDGASFVMTNSVVYGRSKYNVAYVQFPLRFRNVLFGNGKKMKSASEEKMNTEFVGMVAA